MEAESLSGEPQFSEINRRHLAYRVMLRTGKLPQEITESDLVAESDERQFWENCYKNAILTQMGTDDAGIPRHVEKCAIDFADAALAARRKAFPAKVE